MKPTAISDVASVNLPRYPAVACLCLVRPKLTMLRAGAVILTVWAAVRLVLAVGILAMLLVFGKNTPVLVLQNGA
jgi:hypothetical protein